MKSKRMKQIVFGVLLIVAAYIWSDVFYLFTGSEYDADRQINRQSNLGSVSQTLEPIEFASPKVNPFAIRTTSSVPTTQKKNETRSHKPPPASTKLSELYTLIGAVNRPPYSQIVLRDRQGKSTVMGLGDSLSTWQITIIVADFAEFRSGKFVDTLFLVD
ncbi:MAG: hypothetical protein V3V99_01915 [candidate division Zixibacteria bacterium]